MFKPPLPLRAETPAEWAEAALRDPGVTFRPRSQRKEGSYPLREVPEGPAGTGLSLVVCRDLLMRMGGGLEIEGGADRSDPLVKIPVVP